MSTPRFNTESGLICAAVFMRRAASAHRQMVPKPAGYPPDTDEYASASFAHADRQTRIDHIIAEITGTVASLPRQ